MQIGEFEKGANVSLTLPSLPFVSVRYSPYFRRPKQNRTNLLPLLLLWTMLFSRRPSSSIRYLVTLCLIDPSFQCVLLCAIGGYCGVLRMEILRLESLVIYVLYRPACNNTSSSVFISREVM
jgi:hypothetical protein